MYGFQEQLNETFHCNVLDLSGLDLSFLDENQSDLTFLNENQLDLSALISAENKCLLCEKVYKSKRYLSIHKCKFIKIFNTNSIKNFKCDYPNCDKVLRSRNGIVEHKNSIHFNIVYTCPFENCDKKYKHRGHYREHIKSH